MQTLDINNKKISTAFLDATEGVAQYIKPKVIIDFRDSRHLSNVVVTTNSAHANSNVNEVGYYFDSYRVVDGVEYESFPWAVADAKDNYNAVITASGKYRALPAGLEDNLKYSWWSNTKSNSSGVFATQPYLDITFDSTIVNKVKIVTSKHFGQVKSMNLTVVRSNNQTVFDEVINFNVNNDQFEKVVNLGNTYSDITRIYASIISTKNPDDRARIISISPLYRVDITDYIRDINDSRIRDLHETSLPIAGTSQSSCDITIDNTGKEFTLLNSSSQYGKYLEKDIRVFVAYGWLSYGKSSEDHNTSLSSNLSSSESSYIYTASPDGFPRGDILDTGDESNYYVITINKNKFKEEQILVSKRLDTGELEIAQRGFNNTDATDHTAGDSVSFERFEYIQIGERYVEDVRSSTTDMTVSLSTQDSSKFLNDKIIQNGFFRDSVTVPEAIRDLLLYGNHPYDKIYYYNNYHRSANDDGTILHLKFNDDTKNPGSNKVYQGLRFRVYQSNIKSEAEVKDIKLDANELKLSDLDRALGLAASVTPSFTTVKSQINLVNYQLSSDAPSLEDSYYQGVIDGYIIPKYSYPLDEDGVSVEYDEGGVRVYLNDTLVIDGWNYTTSLQFKFGNYDMIVGRPVKIRVEFYHAAGSNFTLKLARTDDINLILTSEELLTNIISDSFGCKPISTQVGFSAPNDQKNDAVPVGDVYFGNNSSIEWFIEDKSISISNANSNSSTVDSFVFLPWGVGYDPTNSAFAVPELFSNPYRDFTIELVFRSPTGPYNAGEGEYISSATTQALFNNSGFGIEFFYSAANNHGARVKLRNPSNNVRTGIAISSTTNMPSPSGWNHIVLTYDHSDKKFNYYVNGEVHATNTFTGDLHPIMGTRGFTFGGRGAAGLTNQGVAKPISSVSSNGINLDVDEFLMYRRCLSANDVKRRYIETQVQEIKIFPFLYGINESIYQTIQNISFADLGRMYLDERNTAIYENYYALFEESIERHSQVQKIISDEDFIIDASIQKTLQVNSVIVKVSGVTASGLVTQSIWRAPDPTTLGVVNLDSNITSTSNSIPASSFDIIPFPRSGYIIIDNEIIKYNNKNDTLFLDAQRGQFGTLPSSHNTNTKIREVRYFNFEYDKTPCVSVRAPFITGILFEDPAEINVLNWSSSPFKANLIIAASETVSSNTVVFAEGVDPTTNKVAYTSIAGIPVQVTDNSNQIIEQKAINSENRRKYGLKEVIIESPFITDASQAQILADFIISKLSEPIPIMDINSTIMPTIQVGDRIKISTLDQFDIINSEYWVVSINTFIGTQFSQSMTLRKVV